MEFPALINWTSSFPILRVFGLYFSILFKFQKKLPLANSGEPDQTPCSMAADLSLRYLPISHKKDARHIWVKFRCLYLLHYKPLKLLSLICINQQQLIYANRIVLIV